MVFGTGNIFGRNGVDGVMLLGGMMLLGGGVPAPALASMGLVGLLPGAIAGLG